MFQTYTFPAELVQSTVSLLAELPARVSRPLLNLIEVECKKQDDARAEAAYADAIRAAVEAANDATAQKALEDRA